MKVFYDGKCSACTIEIGYYKYLKTTEPIEWIDIHQQMAVLKQYNLTFEQSMKTMHVLDSQNQFHKGIDAFIMIWSVLPLWRWFSVVIRFPIFYHVSYILYEMYAFCRYRWHGYHKCSLDS
mgnify:FL=1